MDPAEATGEYIGATLIEAPAAAGAGRRAGGDLGARPRPLLRGRLPGAGRPRRRGRGRRRSATCAGSRSTTTTTSPRRGRSRATTSPDAAQPAVHRRPARARSPASATCSPTGGSPPTAHVAVAVGPGQGERIVEAIRPALANADVFTVARRQPRRGRRPAGRAARQELRRGRRHRRRPDDRRREVRRHPARRCRWWRSPPTSPTTASPRRSARCCTRAARARSAWPADRGGRRPRLRADRAAADGAGPASATWSATSPPIEDWELAARERGEPVDGLAVTFARTAAEAVLHRTDGIESDGFLTALAEALILSGMAMAVAGSQPAVQRRLTTRSCTPSTRSSPAPPTTASWPASGALFCYFLRGRRRARPRRSTRCLRRHELPRLPADLGLTRRAVRRGGRARADDPAGPLHDPRAPRPRRGRRPALGSTHSSRPTPRADRAPRTGVHAAGGSVPQSVSVQTGRSVVAGQVVPARLGTLWGSRRILSLLVDPRPQGQVRRLGARLRLVDPRPADDGRRLLVRLHRC